MILQIDDWYLGYDQIVKDALGSEVGSVWILVNADVDALAAARIMAYMFRSDCVPYQLRPCWSYSSLTNLLKSEDSSEIRSLVLLNLGSSRNLTYLFDENMLMDNARVYVMDCRKPVHLANIHGGDQIVVFWDETQNLDEVPSDGDNLSGHASTTEEEEGSSDDGDESDVDELEDDPDEGETEFEIDTIKKDADESVDLNYDGEDEEDIVDDQEEVILRKRSLDGFSKDDKQKRLKATDKDSKSITTEEESDSASQRDGDALLPTLTPRELHEKRRNRLRTYYAGGSFYGSPVAWIAYRLATQKRWNDNGDLLWLACVGLTDAYLHARIDVAGFASLSVDLKTCCQRIFPNEMVDRIDKVIYAENLSGKDKQNQTQVTVSENGKVLAETDFRFFLLRHSSLFDSMIYSNYVASRLQVWTSQGKQKLQEMLAKMGIPLNECRQPYAFMNPNLKRKLRDKFREFAEPYGLEKLEYTSFNRITGYKSLVSASDMSYAVTGLLESESTDAFHAAFDALNSKVIPSSISSEGYSVSNIVNGGPLASVGIGEGLQRAMLMQKTIVSTAISLIERRAITRLRHFRYAFVTSTRRESKDKFMGSPKGSDQNQHPLCHPLALTRLAHWLMDTHRENGKWTGNKSRPLVLCAENPIQNSYLIVGYEFPDRHGMFLKNHFGQLFRMTCESMKGSFRLDSFDSHVVEVGIDDVQRFIEQLHYMIDSI